MNTQLISELERLDRIEKAAYRKAEARGFEPGHEIEDWIEAEREVDEQIREMIAAALDR